MKSNLGAWAAAEIVALFLGATALSGAELKRETIAAWDSYVELSESRLERELAAQGEPGASAASRAESEVRALAPEGEMVEIPFGTIHHWHGAAFVAGVTLETLLERLKHPETMPRQNDVLSLRVLWRSGDSLRVRMRLERRTIVSVVYDTEHEITFHRLSPTLATSRSVATRIAEVDSPGTSRERDHPAGNDHGFMWRLNAYWRYQQIRGGVRVDLDSLTLSRDIPVLLRPIVRPVLTSIARESMVHALEAVSSK
jgi:hypothetical protein